MGKDLHIASTKNTPKITGLIKDASITIEGSSFPENVRKFYDPLHEWIKNNIESKKDLLITCRFYYMASSSVIAFLKILKQIDSQLDGKIDVFWCFEEGDDDILKIGEDYSKILNMNFSFHAEKEIG